VRIDQETAADFLESVLAGMKAGLFAIDEEARLIAFTRRAESLTGYGKEEVVAGRCYEILKTDRCDECSVKLTHRIPVSPLNYETIATTKSGDKLPLDVTISPLRSAAGEPMGAVGILRDMTEQKRLWEKLLQERDRAKQYLSIARVTIVARDRQGRVTLINKRGCELLGYEEEEITGKDFLGLCVPDRYRPEARRVFSGLMNGTIEAEDPGETRLMVKGGAERTISWQHITLKDDEGRITGLLSSGEDVTDRKKAQDELIRAEKLAAIGQLAAGVAHEVNNPLAGLLVYLKVLLKKYSEGKLQTKETQRQLLDMERETDRSSRIIKALLDFSRQTEPDLRPIDINEAVEATLSIIGHQISLGNVELEKRLASGLPRVVADFDQIQQALMNVALNAIQAMPEGGRLTIETSLAEDARLGESRGDAVRIAISDSGRGIPEEHLEKVFAPFFSTKPTGRGVGLGLAAVQGIIERHQGKLKVESKLNEGTTLTMWLEAMDEQADESTGR
jgi:PAS domain S-box-containing protein